MRFASVVILLVPVLLAATGTFTVRHFQLERSLPAAGAEAANPSAVVLWFTQLPQDAATTVRVLDADGVPAATEALIQDPVDPTVFLLPIPAGLDAGAYTVMWRSMAADGHVVDGEFSFTAVEWPGR